MTDLGNFLVRQTDKLCEDECLASFWVESLYEIANRCFRAQLSGGLRAGGEKLAGDAPTALSPANLVETHVPSDAKDPAAHLMFRREPVEGTDHPDKHFLRKIIS